MSVTPSTIARLHRDTTILCVVDIQERLVPVVHEAAYLLNRCTLLARAAAQLKLPVVVTEQNPTRLGATVPELGEVLRTCVGGDAVPIDKMLFSSCIPATNAALEATGRGTVLLCGIEAHVCVLQTALDLIERGYTVFVPQDGISSRRESDKHIGWERMMRAGAVPTSVESAIFELLREAGTPDFKALLPFFK